MDKIISKIAWDPNRFGRVFYSSKGDMICFVLYNSDGSVSLLNTGDNEVIE